MEKRIRIVQVLLLSLNGAKKNVTLDLETKNGVSPALCVATYIRKWRRSEGSGYDKLDFRLVYEDGHTYDGRFDIQANESRSLLMHVKSFVDYQLNRKCAEGTGDYLIQQQWKTFADKYEYTDAHASELSRG